MKSCRDLLISHLGRFDSHDWVRLSLSKALYFLALCNKEMSLFVLIWIQIFCIGNHDTILLDKCRDSLIWVACSYLLRNYLCKILITLRIYHPFVLVHRLYLKIMSVSILAALYAWNGVIFIALMRLLVNVLLMRLVTVAPIQKVLYRFSLVAHCLQMFLLYCRLGWQWMTPTSESDTLSTQYFRTLLWQRLGIILKVTLTLFRILGRWWPLNHFSSRPIKIGLACLLRWDYCSIIASLCPLKVVCLLAVLLLD